MGWYTIIKEGLEVLYYIASIGLFAGIILATKQLKVMKTDFSSRNQRASVEKSIEYLNWYATSFLPDTLKSKELLKNKKILTFESVKNKSFIYDENCKRDDQVITSINEKIDAGIVELTNQLEFFSAAMMSGLADEQLAFNPLASTFCSFVDVYCEMRNEDKEMLFTHTTELYNMWEERLRTIELSKKKALIDEQMSKVSNKTIPILGNK